MKLRSILAGTALAALTLVAAPQPGGITLTTPAEAAVNVNIGIFYDQLGQYGDWVDYDDQYVFIPGRVDPRWRPYTEGHWVYTRQYGWTWISDEPFGWATYHYGRWGYSRDIGWYWVPGRKWAPAWVSWRRSNDYVVWAPLPPSRGGDVDVSINFNAGDIPDYYWVAVPTRRFLAPDLQVVMVNDDREIRNVVQRTEYVGTPRITNNIVVNNVIDVNVISREAGRKVDVVDVKTTSNPAEARSTARQVTAFQGELAADTKAKPKKLVDVNEVKKVKRSKFGAGSQPTPDANAPGADGAARAPANDGSTATGDQSATTDADEPVTGKNKDRNMGKAFGKGAKPPAATAAGQTGEPPAAQGQDQTGGKKKRQQQQDQNASAPAGTEQPATQAQDQAGGKKKKRQQQQDQNASAPAGGDQPSDQAQGQFGKKKKKQQGGDEATGSTSAPAQFGHGNGNAPDQTGNEPANQNRKGKGKKNQACDPSDPSCVAQ